MSVLFSLLYALCSSVFFIFIKQGYFRFLLFLVFVFLYGLLCFVVSDVAGLEPKYAEYFGYFTARGEMYVSTFLVQAAMLHIPMVFYDYPLVVNSLNIFLCALYFFIIAILVHNNKIPFRIAFLCLLCIPNFYFSLYGLRDPILLLAMLTIVYGYLFVGGVTGFIFFLIGSVVLIISRPELIAFPFLIFVLPFVLLTRPIFRWFFFTFFVVAILSVSEYFPLLFGVEEIASDPAEFVEDFGESRYQRHADGVGGGSHIMGGALYSLPFVLRYPIQVLAFFINPLPSDFNSILYVVPLLDSLVFCFLFLYCFANRGVSHKVFVVIWASIVVILAMSLFSSNYGNLFRLRYPFYAIFSLLAIHIYSVRFGK